MRARILVQVDIRLSVETSGTTRSTIQAKERREFEELFEVARGKCFGRAEEWLGNLLMLLLWDAAASSTPPFEALSILNGFGAGYLGIDRTAA